VHAGRTCQAEEPLGRAAGRPKGDAKAATGGLGEAASGRWCAEEGAKSGCVAGALRPSPALYGLDVDLFAVFALKQRDCAGLSYAWDRGHIRHPRLAFDAKRRHRPSRWGRCVVGHRPVLLFAGGSAVGSLSHRCQRRRTDDVRLTPTLEKTFPRNLVNYPSLTRGAERVAVLATVMPGMPCWAFARDGTQPPLKRFPVSRPPGSTWRRSPAGARSTFLRSPLTRSSISRSAGSIATTTPLCICAMCYGSSPASRRPMAASARP
jgi:hypothetical protein